jgi:hypothetical protein
MLHWWFTHIGEPVTYAGEPMSGYLVWHPLDHIRRELGHDGAGEIPRGGQGISPAAVPAY